MSVGILRRFSALLTNAANVFTLGAAGTGGTGGDNSSSYCGLVDAAPNGEDGISANDYTY